jgi:aminoglycoside/choline kinase family phosphotransferase
VTSLIVKKGWEVVDVIASDGSSRRYTRIRKDNRSMIAMECDGTTPSHRISDYVRIAEWLRGAGLKVPEIYDGSEEAGYLLIEDFGGISFKAAIEKGKPATYYGLAAEVWKVMAQAKCDLDLPQYFSSHIDEGHRRVIDWYVPVSRKQKNADGLAEEYQKAWAEIEESLPECLQGFVHADYHAENLLWLENEKGLARCGIIDFQGAMRGPVAYDLGNLLEDARINMPQDIQDEILKTYDQDFLAWYRVLTTQFHCRVIGQFIKMAVQDGKTQYLVHIPRLEGYIRSALKEPILAPLRGFFAREKVDFGGIKDLNSEGLKRYIRPDAY